MSKISIFNNFTKLFQVNKTIRQELVPVGKTMENIKTLGYFERDFQRAKDFNRAKEIANDYHREYIDISLNALVQENNSLIVNSLDLLNKAYLNMLNEPKNKKMIREYESLQVTFRKLIAKGFKGQASLFKAGFINTILPEWMEKRFYSSKDLEIIKSFNKFTGYFDNYFTSKKNLYTSDDKATSIVYRIVHENIPLYFNNCINFGLINAEGDVFDYKAVTKSLEMFLNKSIDECFNPQNALNYIVQSNIDNYNAVNNGVNNEDGSRTPGLNKFIYEYISKAEQKPEFKGFKKLKKQMLSLKESLSFIPDFFNNDKECMKALNESVDLFTKRNGLIDSLSEVMLSINKCDTSHIYIKTNKIKFLSNAIFGNYQLINYVLKKADVSGLVIDLKKLDELISMEQMSCKKGTQFYDVLRDVVKNAKPVQTWLQSHFAKLRDDLDMAHIKAKPVLKLSHLDHNRRLPGTRDENDEGGKGFLQVQVIQRLLNNMNSFVKDFRPLMLVDNKKDIEVPDVEHLFYTPFVNVYSEIDELMFVVYNKVRNHLNKKSRDVSKVKINFDNSIFLTSWSSSKEAESLSMIFERNGLYYLGVLNPDNRKILNYNLDFNECLEPKKASKKLELLKNIKCSNGSGYNKLNYSMLTDFSRMGPKVFVSALNRRNFFKPSDEILDITNVSSHTQGGKPKPGFDKAEFDLDDCHTVIDYFKSCINKHPVWKKFNFKFSDTNTYNNVSDFYAEVDAQAYKLDFTCIKKDYIDAAVENGELFLFQIHNQDFKQNFKGKPNLHTMYLKGLFEPENIKDTILKLNGGAEFFFRPKSITKKMQIVHKAGIPIKNKNMFNPKKTSTYDFDIIKDKRYTEDKMFLHFPITLNSKSPSQSYYYNRNFNKHIKKTGKDVNILALKRGERNLLYYVLLDQDSNIIEQDTLDRHVGFNNALVDYQTILKKKEHQRAKSRFSWASLDNISNLKQGFLSLVVHKLTKLMIEHNALLCIDGLETGFRQARQKFEANIYDSFLVSLVNKLNYLVFKDAKNGEAGHYLNAYQLANKFDSLKMIGKQSGAMLVTNSSFCTSMCPRTGFVNLVRLKNNLSVKKAKVVLKQFESLKYNPKTKDFELSFDYSTMYPKRNFGGYQTKWTVCTHGDERFHYDKPSRKFESVNVSKELFSLFTGAHIDFEKGENILGAIDDIKPAVFFKDLFFFLNLVLKMRQINSKKDIDFFISPILDKNGSYYDSRSPKNYEPSSSDAIGAYHVGLKGLWCLNQIQGFDYDNDSEKLDLFLDNDVFFEYAKDVATKKV